MVEWWKNAEELRKRLEAAGSMQALADSTGVPRTNLRRWAKKFNISISPLGNDEIVVRTLPPHAKRSGLRTPEAILTDHGLDPAEWDVVSYKDNFWQVEQGVTPNAQSKVTAKRRVPAGLIAPARTDAPLRKQQRARKPSKDKPLLIALPSDQHAPHHDLGLHSCWLAWNEMNRPDKRVGMGDLAQYSKPSRWSGPLNPDWAESAAESGQAGHDWWRDTINAWDGAQDEQIPGNHDLRPSIYCEQYYPDAFNIKRPGEEHPWHDMEYLQGLDQLGVKYHRPTRSGEYWVSKVEVAPGLWVHHGVKAGKHGGAMKDIDRHETSRAQGHDHKQAITYVVRFRGDEPHQHLALSVGTMSRRDKAHNQDADINLGFATLVLHKNGYWNVELARYDDRRGVLTWRDQMIEAA